MYAHLMHHVPPHSVQPPAKLCSFVLLTRIRSVIEWSPVLVIRNERFPIPGHCWITLARATTTASWQTVLLNHVCEVAAVSLALMMARYTGTQQGFAYIYCRTQERQQARQQAPALYRRQNLYQTITITV
jgi:hypothetical protein